MAHENTIDNGLNHKHVDIVCVQINMCLLVVMGVCFGFGQLQEGEQGDCVWEMYMSWAE